ncbi:hypothetical protein [Azonexus sp.]|uniref:hypothetical protein n=1 Tax=Azonexus sp. TaxID=1872668 RepID=UPI0035ADD0D5
MNKQQNAALEKLAEQHGMELDEYLETATGKPVGPTVKKGLRAAETGMPVRPWYAGTDSRDERTGLELERLRRVQAANDGSINDPVKSAIVHGVIGQPQQVAPCSDGR